MAVSLPAAVDDLLSRRTQDPGRLDDLMGEAANVQELSPELVIGDVVVVDEAEDSVPRDGRTWADHFEANRRNIAIRKAPLWNQGLIEGAWLIRIDSRQLLAPADLGRGFSRRPRDDVFPRPA